VCLYSTDSRPWLSAQAPDGAKKRAAFCHATRSLSIAYRLNQISNRRAHHLWTCRIPGICR